MFNLGSFSNATVVNTSKPQLKPYGSYKVKITDIKIETVTKKDNSKSWETIKIYFEGEQGNYTHTIFFPNLTEGSEDVTRPKLTNDDGHEYERPSALENTMYLILQILTVINPVGADKFKKILPQAKDFKQLADVFIKLVNEKKSKEVWIKLIGRNSKGSIYATLPSCIGLNKADELFPINVISTEDNFNWSAYELDKQKEYLNAKPTTMKDTTDSSSKDNDEEDDLTAMLDSL